MYLATTAISELWDLDSKLLLLGPWCLANKSNKDLLKCKEYMVIPSPWKPARRIKEAGDYCHEIYKSLLPQLSDNLNLVHNVSYPIRYWRILIGPWLLQFIEVFYDRYRRIEKAFEVAPDFYTYTLSREQCKLASFDILDFLSNVTAEDHYNFKLFSIVISYLYPSKAVEREYKYEPKIYSETLPLDWKIRLFNKLLKSFDLFFKPYIALCDMHHLTPKDIASLKIKRIFSTFRFLEFEAIGKDFLRDPLSPEMREVIKLRDGNDKFQLLLYRILPQSIPMSYVENYRFYKSSVSNVRNESYAKMIGSAVGWYSNERFKFFAAEKALKGSILIDFQHGGVFGTSLSMPSEKLSLEKDICYTWGWDSKKDNRIRPLPSPYLSKLKNTHSPRLYNIVFAGTAFPAYHYRFHTTLMPDDMAKYFDDKKIFFQNLPQKIRDKILYRPYFHDYGWGDIDMIKKVCPNVTLLLNGRLVSWMQKARLAVIDNPYTSFIEALVINVPCVFYWDHEVNLMRPEAESYFDLLREAGILYRDPESAAKKAAEVFNDPAEWWLDERVQKARLAFCEKFGYARKDWLKIWAQELDRVLKEG